MNEFKQENHFRSFYLHSFYATYTNANICFLKHSNIICAVTNSQCRATGFDFHQPRNLQFLKPVLVSTFTENVKQIRHDKPKKALENEHTRAFCLGDERQQMTDAQPMASSRNMSFTSFSKAYESDFPSIINANASQLSSFDLVSNFFPSVIWWTTLAFNA